MPSSEDQAPNAPVFSGPVLVLEDTAMIALEVGRMAEELGATEVHVVTNAKDALAIVAEEPLQAAFLDFGLKVGTSAKVAEKLAERGVPYVFASGYAGTSGMPPRFSDHPTLVKPFSPGDIREIFAALL